jgi:PAS domain S-box-containing protein
MEKWKWRWVRAPPSGFDSRNFCIETEGEKVSDASILIVDDEIIIARELEARLIGMGHRIAGMAASGEEAIAMAEERRPDLVLMDIVLKGEMDGIEAAAEIRRRFQLPILFVTAYTDRTTLDRAKITEPFGYVVKPFSERELEATIEMALYKHRSESRLRKVERWFADTVNGFPSAVIAADREGNITFFNNAAEVITKWPRKEALGRGMEDILRLIDNQNGSRFRFHQALEGPTVTFSDEHHLIDRQNTKVPIDLTLSPIRDEEDKPNGMVSVFWDSAGGGHSQFSLAHLLKDVTVATSESINLRGMLQLCAESIVRNLDAALARIWVTDSASENTLILQGSAGLYTHLDGPHGKIPMGKFKIGKIAKTRQPHLTNDLAHDPLVSNPAWVKEEKLVSFAGYPLIIEDRVVGVMGMFSHQRMTARILESLGSIARLMAIGIERKKLESRFQRAQKMEAIGQLAGGIAHDFNNLLMIINGNCELILEGFITRDEFTKVLAEIAHAGKRASTLTRQLLAFSRNQAVEVRILNLNMVIENMESMIRRLLGEDIEFNTALDRDLDPVLADGGQIEQIIMNLIVNARDAMPEGGRLTIETQNRVLGDALTHPGLDPGNYVQIGVSDSGSGMTPEVANRVFEPFFTTKGVGKGTGLGLSTVFGIVKQFNGEIEVYTEVGIGTTFKIYFPAAGASEIPQATERAAGVLPHGTETILLVEDEAPVRELISRILEGCGYTVLQAGDGVEGVEVCGHYPGEIDLIVTDVVMPRLGGGAFTEKIAEKRPGIPVLYMSGYTDDAIVRHGILKRNNEFIQKPFTPGSLAQRVRMILDRAH